MTQVQEIAEREPWRTRQGHPATILDPTWQGEQRQCDGEVDWEGTSRWWFCKKCGYCGTATTTMHIAAIHPRDDVAAAIEFFMSKRAEQGLEHDLAMNQLLFVAASAIRYAASIPADQVGQYVREHIVVR